VVLCRRRADQVLVADLQFGRDICRDENFAEILQTE
jgi:hypothetical protein